MFDQYVYFLVYNVFTGPGLDCTSFNVLSSFQKIVLRTGIKHLNNLSNEEGIFADKLMIVQVAPIY